MLHVLVATSADRDPALDENLLHYASVLLDRVGRYRRGRKESARREYQRGRELDEQLLHSHRRTHGDDHPTTLSMAENLALDLHELGKYQAARALDEDTLTRRRRVLGDGHPSTLNTAHNLAFDLHKLGEHHPARALGEDALTRRRDVLGDDHHDTLDTAHTLALDLEELGAREQAAVWRSWVAERRASRP